MPQHPPDWFDVQHVALLVASSEQKPIWVQGTDDGYIKVVTVFHRPEVIVAPGEPINVSTLTPLLGLRDLGLKYSSLLFTLFNLSPTNPATLVIQTSEDGQTVDSDAVVDDYVAEPLSQTSLEIGPNVLRRHYAMAAHSASPSYPTVPVRFMVSGISRY